VQQQLTWCELQKLKSPHDAFTVAILLTKQAKVLCGRDFCSSFDFPSLSKTCQNKDADCNPLASNWVTHQIKAKQSTVFETCLLEGTRFDTLHQMSLSTNRNNAPCDDPFLLSRACTLVQLGKLSTSSAHQQKENFSSLLSSTPFKALEYRFFHRPWNSRT